MQQKTAEKLPRLIAGIVYAVREKCSVYAGKGYKGTNMYIKADICGSNYPSTEYTYRLTGRDSVFAGISDSVDTYVYYALKKLIV